MPLQNKFKSACGTLQKVIGKVVDHAQSRFILSKQMADNILLAAELGMGYSLKNNSPRCMINVNLKKVYDSIDWGFICSILKEMRFPQTFIEWIRKCTTSFNFSILVNGKLLKPFLAPKGLRQGAPFLNTCLPLELVTYQGLCKR